MAPASPLVDNQCGARQRGPRQRHSRLRQRTSSTVRPGDLVCVAAKSHEEIVRANLFAYLNKRITRSDEWPIARRDELVGELCATPGHARFCRRTEDHKLRADKGRNHKRCPLRWQVAHQNLRRRPHPDQTRQGLQPTPPGGTRMECKSAGPSHEKLSGAGTVFPYPQCRVGRRWSWRSTAANVSPRSARRGTTERMVKPSGASAGSSSSSQSMGAETGAPCAARGL